MSAPSDAARELVRGAFDLHVHIDPDVIPRRIGDVALARRFAELGLAGFQLNSHYTQVVDEDGKVVPQLRDVLATVKLHRMLPATGHLGRDESFAVVGAAREEGVQDIVITHPEFPSQSLPAEDQRALAGKGALLERCFTTPHTGKVEWEVLIANARACGAEKLGALHRPRPARQPAGGGRPRRDGEGFVAAGFSEHEVRTMGVQNTRPLAAL